MKIASFRKQINNLKKMAKNKATNNREWTKVV